MHDAREKGGVRVLMGDALGDDARQCGDVGGMFPELGGQSEVFFSFDISFIWRTTMDAARA